MSVPTTIPEINKSIKDVMAGVRQAIKTMTGLSVDNSKLAAKLGKTETKLEEAKLKATGKKVAAPSNSAAASASESSSVGSEKPLTATAAKALPDVQQLVAILEQLDALTDLVKGLPKPGKAKAAAVAKSDEESEPKTATNAFIAWQPSKLFPADWVRYKEECKPAKEAIKEEIAAREAGDPAIEGLKKQQRQIGSVMAFNGLCRESTHKAEWEAFQAAWALEHPKKGGAMGGGGAL